MSPEKKEELKRQLMQLLKDRWPSFLFVFIAVWFYLFVGSLLISGGMLLVALVLFTKKPQSQVTPEERKAQQAKVFGMFTGKNEMGGSQGSSSPNHAEGSTTRTHTSNNNGGSRGEKIPIVIEVEVVRKDKMADNKSDDGTEESSKNEKTGVGNASKIMAGFGRSSVNDRLEAALGKKKKKTDDDDKKDDEDKKSTKGKSVVDKILGK